MAESTSVDRLLPCLLDRLTDEQPELGRESGDRKVVTMRQYRNGVRRDLESLLNASSRGGEDPLMGFEHASRSVLNFGIPDLCGQTLSGLGFGDLERQIRDAILRFEPRIMPRSLAVVVARDESGGSGRHSLFLEITGELWAAPTPEALFYRTEVDLETGQFEIKDRSHG